MSLTSYAIALGSNRRGRHGGPAQMVRAGLEAVGGVVAASTVIETAPVGPSQRRFANMAAIVATDEPPDALLARLKAIEAAFGRRRGQRWGARVIDLDIILWSGGAWVSPGLTIPHPAFRARDFVLRPLAQIAPGWRDPVSGRTIRQLVAIDRAPCAA
ncbi:MAG: 2-amino-4-hydroxy-6-hydroxymethyldihydropteridine diphosphokinase [Sphingomonas sp.]|nr:2-amino-4-hydroxy-6-hydroxymethyldihydropteridine diphosphokinase [Sphingomonas sp.]